MRVKVVSVLVTDVIVDIVVFVLLMVVEVCVRVDAVMVVVVDNITWRLKELVSSSRNPFTIASPVDQLPRPKFADHPKKLSSPKRVAWQFDAPPTMKELTALSWKPLVLA